MSVRTTCKACGVEFTADDEDGLVTQVQAHIAEMHDRGHSPSREQILAVIRRRHGRDA
jgi:predicted small metal-binding protein